MTRAHVPLTAAACLLLGAAINVLVAWACDRWLVDARAPLVSRRAAVDQPWPGPVPESWPPAVRRDTSDPRWMGVTFQCRGFGWSQYGTLVGGGQGPSFDYRVLTTGLPCRSLRRDELFEFDVTSFPGVYAKVASTLHAGLSRHVLATPETMAADLNRRFGHAPLPILPMWPGFLLNTLFYACAVWPLLRIPRRLRARSRRRRGLCPRCAYPIGSSPTCTECGAAIGSNRHTEPAHSPGQPQRGGRV